MEKLNKLTIDPLKLINAPSLSIRNKMHSYGQQREPGHATVSFHSACPEAPDFL